VKTIHNANQRLGSLGTKPALRNLPMLLPLLLLIAATCGAAKPPKAKWKPWQQATLPDGSAYAALQFRWRSNPPCTEVGCRLDVQIRNTSHAPLQLHCAVYVDPPPLPYEDEVRPVIVDVRLEKSGTHTKKRKAGDTTNPLTIRGLSITGVVVRPSTLR
jgi:hypothetical protein